MNKIHWRPVLGFVLYWVSTDGRVKSFHKTRKILRPGIEKGYCRVSLWNGERGRSIRVHRLVAEAFKRKQHGKDEVNHKDADKANNNHTNLEWTDHLGNMQHCDSLGLRIFASGERHGMSKLTDDQVSQVRAMIGTVSYLKIMKQFGIGVSQYYRIKNNQSRAV